MPLIEGFRVQNYRALRDVTIGRLAHHQTGEPLTPLTVVIGKNGSGKSSLFDAFGFLADSLSMGVEAATDQERRGGFERVRTHGVSEPIQFELAYRDDHQQQPFTYTVTVDVDASARPFVASEMLIQRETDGQITSSVPFFRMFHGHGLAWAGEDAVERPGPASNSLRVVELTDSRQLGIATLGTLRDHPRIVRFRDFLKGWYLSYFDPAAARGLPLAGPQPHLNERGNNVGNVVQYMQREHGDRFKSVLKKIAERIPGIQTIDTHITEDKRVLLRFNDNGFVDPFFAQQMSDGTLKLFAYLLLLEDPDPPPLICIEEPENGLYHKILETLVHEFRAHATGLPNAPQIFVTTHQPYLVDALAPEEVWLLEKDGFGFSSATRASDLQIVRNLVAEGLPLGGLWYSDYLDQA